MGIVGVFLSLFAFIVGTTAECNSRWLQNGTSCYYFVHERYNWFDAQSACHYMGAKLTEIGSAEENQFVSDLVMTQGHDGYLSGKIDLAKFTSQSSVNARIFGTEYSVKTLREVNFGLNALGPQYNTRRPYYVPVLDAWIGLEDFADEGTFVWATSREPPVQSFWSPGEPNDSGAEEDCVYIFKEAKWVDQNCEKYPHPFVCEMPANEEEIIG